MTKEIKLGDRAKCLVTGFKGIVTEKIECLNGCLRYELTESVRKDIPEVRNLVADSQQIVKVDDGINKVKKTKQTKTGGPMKVTFK